MSRFVRFVFLLVLLGVGVNLAIVLLANSRSERQHLASVAEEKQQFNNIIARFNGRQRRGDMAVEWQKIDADHKVLETSLLVRLYTLNDQDERQALHDFHVVIPGDKVNIDGMLVAFPDSLPDEYAALRGAKLAYFNHIYADGQSIDDRFSILTHGDPPLPTRMNPDHVTNYETQFWKLAWDLIDASLRSKTTASPVAQNTASVSRVVTPGVVYSFYISNFDSVPAINLNTDPGLFYELFHEPIPTDNPSR